MSANLQLGQTLPEQLQQQLHRVYQALQTGTKRRLALKPMQCRQIGLQWNLQYQICLCISWLLSCSSLLLSLGTEAPVMRLSSMLFFLASLLSARQVAGTQAV